MSARLCWTEQNATGDGQAGLTVKLHRYQNGAEIGTFTDDGGGVYHYDHNISEKVIVKVGGVTRTGSNGMMFPADDVALATTLASTATGAGASLIGVKDAAARFSGTNIEAILIEIATLAGLASTSGGFGASLIGSTDNGGYYAGTNVEAILQEIGAIVSLLTGLTATAAELNKLDGASANVTAVNLGILTAGDTSDAGGLHRHDMEDLLGNLLQGNGQTDMNLILKSQFTDQYGVGNVVLNVVHSDVAGKAQVYKFGLSEQDVILTEIMTAFEIGDLNFSGSPIIGNVMFPGKITNAIKLLAAAAAQTISQVGFSTQLLWSAGTQATSSIGSAAADPATTVLWDDTSTNYVVKKQLHFDQIPGAHYVRVKLEARNTDGGGGSIKIEIASQSMEAPFSGATYVPLVLYIDLTNLPVSIVTERTLKISLKSFDAEECEVNCKARAYQEL